jgi:hypothetical protein
MKRLATSVLAATSGTGKAKNFVTSPLGFAVVGCALSLTFLGLAAFAGNRSSGGELADRYSGREYSSWFFPLNPDRTDTGLFGVGRRVIIGSSENTGIAQHITNVAYNLLYNSQIYAIPAIVGAGCGFVRSVFKKKRCARFACVRLFKRTVFEFAVVFS